MPWFFITNKGFNYKIAVKTGKDNREIRLGEGLGFFLKALHLDCKGKGKSLWLSGKVANFRK